MRGHDYNGDGRINSHDSAIFHNVIMNGSGGSGGGSSGGGGGSSSLVTTIIVLIIMEIFKPGKLFSGIFPTLVWLVCLGILFVQFACWLESK